MGGGRGEDSTNEALTRRSVEGGSLPGGSVPPTDCASWAAGITSFESLPRASRQ
jgi:hypothetical protein